MWHPPLVVGAAVDALGAIDPRLRLAAGGVAVIVGAIAASVGVFAPVLGSVAERDAPGKRRGLQPTRSAGDDPEPAPRGRPLALVAVGVLTVAAGAVLFWSALAG